MNFFKRIYGMVVKPKETLDDIIEKAPVWQGLIIIVILSLLPVFIMFNKDIILNNLGTGVNPYDIDIITKMLPIMTIMGVFFAMILTPIFQFIWVGMYNMISDFLGHKGSGKSLFAAFGFTSVPSIFSLLIYAVLVNTSVQFLSTIFSLLISIWVIMLQIIALKKNYKMGTGTATLTYFIPWIITIVIVGLFIILGILTMIPIMQELSNQLIF